MTEESIQPTSRSSFNGYGKPAVLHVLHSWGGGIDFFARDLKAGDKSRNHFFLKSHSRDNMPPFGKELCLYDDLENCPLATWHLSNPVMDTDVHSDEVVRILHSIIEKWAIGAVVVSSLIGHSLDVLKTGLPTALAIHDVYPLWPLLHDPSNDDYSIEYLRRSLAENATMNVFAQHDVQYWLAIRNALISVVLENKIACVSPSVFAKDRVCRIDSRLVNASWSIISHGVDMPTGHGKSLYLNEAGNLRVVIPGHINGGKGELLLNDLVPQLPSGIDLVLLGSAHLSNHFASEKVATIDHYNRAELGDILAKIRPDIALLASTVPETYGYVLSEMLQSGVPVICSNIGAYGERAKALPGVTVVAPDVKSFLDALILFRDNPRQLEQQKQNLPYVFPDVREMANTWASVLPANTPTWLFEFTDDPGIEKEVQMNLQLTHLTEILKAVQGTTEKNSQSSSEVLNTISQQQSNIERLLESINMQNQQLAAMLLKQSELEAMLLNKSNEIALLKNQMDEQKNTFQQAIIIFESESESKVAAISESILVNKLDFQAQSIELKSNITRLNEELISMQSKRGWRFLNFFK